MLKTIVSLSIFVLFSFNMQGQSTNAATNVPPPSDGVTPDAIIKKTKDTYAALKSYSDTGSGSTHMGSFDTSVTFTTRLQRPGFYFVDWQSSGPMGKGVVWSDGTGDFLQSGALGLKKETSRELALASATGISGGIAASIPGTFFAEHWGDKLTGAHERKGDEKIDGVDCYVLTHLLNHDGNDITTILWIGKQDSLIHQIKTKMSKLPQIPPVTDDTIKKTLAMQNKPATPEAIEALRKQLTTAREMAAAMLKSGGIEFTELHTHIVTDKAFTPDDFKPTNP